MVRKTAQWIAYLITVIAWCAGLKSSGIFPRNNNHPCLWELVSGLYCGAHWVR